MTIDYLKYGAVVAIVGAVYLVGYKHAETEGERAMEALKLQHAQAIIEATKEEQKKYEKDIARLVADLESLRSEHDGRLLQLKNFSQSRADLQACLSERNALAELSVRGESLLKRSIKYLESQVRQ